MGICRARVGHGKVACSYSLSVKDRAKGCSSHCLLELQLPNEIKMPASCLCAHLVPIGLSGLMSLSQESK